jgi:hypothetical protein
MTEPAQLSIAGRAVPIDTSLTLRDGWNLIGYMPEEEMSIPTALASLEEDLQVVLGEHGTYVADKPLFGTLTTMQDSRGYWIRLARARTLTYPAPGSTGAGKPAPAWKESPVVAITPTWVDFCGEASLEGHKVCPGDVVTVHDPDDVQCGFFVVRRAGQYGYLRVYGDDAFTTEDEGGQPGDRLTFFINGLPALGESPAIWTTDKSVTKLALRAASEAVLPAPVPFDLCQNYPNPFNPSTVITYQLPIQTQVVIAVHDALGQVLCTLVQGVVGPGTHETIWNGRNAGGQEVGSGIYFYWMKAGDFVKVRKMLVVR